MAVAHSWHEPRTKAESNLLRTIWRLLLPLLVLEVAAARIAYLLITHAHAFFAK